MNCQWPDCDRPGFVISGNFADRTVCREHFRITNGDYATFKRACDQLIAAGLLPSDPMRLEEARAAILRDIEVQWLEREPDWPIEVCMASAKFEFEFLYPTPPKGLLGSL
jgi:hypothetical protein